jgi:hypothetical protein
MAIFPKDTGGKDALQEPRDPGQSLRKVPSFHYRPPLRLQRRRQNVSGPTCLQSIAPFRPDTTGSKSATMHFAAQATGSP